ncbi:MAG: hypothetical protein AB9900_10810 [Humidesulfovibrio sp.]
MPKHLVKAAIVLCVLISAAGCSGTTYDGIDYEYVTNAFPVARIGICGPLSSDAANEFMYAGYLAADLGPDVVASMDAFDDRSFTFVAVAGTVAYDTPDPLGFSSYGMRVLDLKTGQTLWTSEGEYQNRAALRRESRPVSEVFREMVADFARSYPPARTPGPGH